MIIYRPHRGGLKESLAEAKEFESIEEMKAYIVKDWAEMYANIGFPCAPFEADDIVLGEESKDDSRCGWHDTRYVCVKRMGKEIYSCPQCIGHCATDYEK